MATMTMERINQREVVFSRTFQAPRTLVWEAWTKAEHLANWWGPEGFTTEVRSMDFRPGGAWHYCMRSSDWGDAWGRAEYIEIEPPSRLVFRDGFSDEAGSMNPPIAISTVTFEEHDGVTTVRDHTVYETAGDLEKVLEMGMEQGLASTLDRLEGYLTTLA